jgi:hypothetical protein
VYELPRIREYLYGVPASLLGDDEAEASATSAKQRLMHLEAIRLLLDEAERQGIDAPSVIMKALRDAIDAEKNKQYLQDNEDRADPYDPRPANFGGSVHN